jgi:muramoyltetrapeptide carboxypeptidase
LVEAATDAVLCARGGYGASDLLPLLEWDTLTRAKEKVLVGFSDASALHSGLFARLGWRGIHGPMPATGLWGKNSTDDVSMLMRFLEPGEAFNSFALRPISAGSEVSQGWLFGGCFSVLTNLIGTPYFPKSLEDAFLILEDIDEAPARLMRYWNQWIQSGILRGVRAIILGEFVSLGGDVADNPNFLFEQFAKRSRIPVYSAASLGHVSPNFPFVIGARAEINAGRLSWRADQQSSRIPQTEKLA